MKLIDFGEYCNDGNIRALMVDMDPKTKQIAMCTLMLFIMRVNIFRAFQTDAFTRKIEKYTSDARIKHFLEAVKKDQNVSAIINNTV